MIRIFIVSLFAFSAYLWSDWRNWRAYHSTILFVVMGDFLYNFLTYNYSLWELHSELGGHTINDLLITLVSFPSVVLLVLTHFPFNKKIMKKILFIVYWIFLFSIIEFAMKSMHGIIYFHGWSFGWSVLFNVYIFVVIPIHHKKPLLAYGLSLIMFFFIYFTLDIPTDHWK